MCQPLARCATPEERFEDQEIARGHEQIEHQPDPERQSHTSQQNTAVVLVGYVQPIGYTLEKTLSGSGGVARGICALADDDLLERVTELQNVHRREGGISGERIDGMNVELSGLETVSMNLWGFTPPVVDLLRRQFRQFLEEWGDDPQVECLLPTMVNAQIELEATRVRVLQAPDTWFGVTHPDDRDRAETILRERVASGTYPRRLADVLARLS